MPAKSFHRINKESTYIHVYNKGIENKNIFSEAQDYEVFTGFLKEYLTPPKPEAVKREFTVHGRVFHGTPHQPKNYFNKVELTAYSLMPNHFHLLLHQKTRGSVENFLRSLLTRYSIYFNKKYNRKGSLFEGPYKSVQINDQPGLLHLTRFFHRGSSQSSYQEYLGLRKTSWVNSNIILSTINKDGYKDFVEKYKPNQNEKNIIEGITLESELQHFNHQPEKTEVKRNEVIDLEPILKTHEFLMLAAVVFLILTTLGVRNIQASTKAGLTPHKILGASVKSTNSPKPTASYSPTVIVVVKINDGATSVNIRQKPDFNSEKIGEAKNGETFEFVSINSGWYEVKLANGSIGYIYATYIQ